MVVPIFVKRSTALEEMDWQQILEVSCSQNKLHALHSGYTYTDLWLSLTADSSHMHVPMYSVNNPKGQQSPSASMAVPWSSGNVLISWRAHKPQVQNKMCTLQLCVSTPAWLGWPMAWHASKVYWHVSWKSCYFGTNPKKDKQTEKRLSSKESMCIYKITRCI